MFTKDDRFQLVPDPPLGEADDFGRQNMGRQDWTLMIKFVTARDSGAYECQVSYSIYRVSQQVLDGLRRLLARPPAVSSLRSLGPPASEAAEAGLERLKTSALLSWGCIQSFNLLALKLRPCIADKVKNLLTDGFLWFVKNSSNPRGICTAFEIEM